MYTETAVSAKTGPFSEINSLGPPAGSLNSLIDTVAIQTKRGGNRGAMTQQILELGRKASRHTREKKATGLGPLSEEGGGRG